MSEKGFQFGPVLTDRVIAVVKRVDDMPYRYGNASIPTRFEDDGDGGGTSDPVFRICTFTASWNKNTDKTVTFKYQEETPSTALATNLFADITNTSGQKNCAIAREGTAWFLIAAEC